MAPQRKTPVSYTLGLTLLYIPSALGLLMVFEILPSLTWIRITVSVLIIGCVGFGSYLAWWGKRPRQARGDWKPSKTLPEDHAE